MMTKYEHIINFGLISESFEALKINVF